MADYKIYPTLLDSYSWYARSEDPEEKQKLIDKINRVPVAKTDAMIRGQAFNDIVDDPNWRRMVKDGFVTVHDKKCSEKVIAEFHNQFQEAIKQVYVSAELKTPLGVVELYGFIDELMKDVWEIKTTGNYTFPKYLHNWQHPVYLYCLREKGADVKNFIYKITDFRNVYEELYTWTQESHDRMVSEVCRLIEFIEINKDIIKDEKIFGK